MRTGAEIKLALDAFVTRWSGYGGTERAAQYVIACNFREFELWEPGAYPTQPLATFTLDQLPDRYDLLLFLQDPSRRPVLVEHRRERTTEAAKHIADLYPSLADRSAAPADEIQRFAMQVVWCFFAEDLGMLEGYPLQAVVNDLLEQAHPDSARDIGYLFQLLNQKTERNREITEGVRPYAPFGH